MTPGFRSGARVVVAAALGVAALVAAPRRAAAQLLLVNPTTISFPSADPDATPVISAPPVRVTYLVLGPSTRTWRITIRANGQLTSGASTIPISNIAWTATPAPPFRSGTLSTLEQTLATGSGTELLQRGNVTFRFTNSWNYPVGTYTQTITFTLSSP
jgi:hypothetical protein